jgi:hypothetical protein
LYVRLGPEPTGSRAKLSTGRATPSYSTEIFAGDVHVFATNTAKQ